MNSLYHTDDLSSHFRNNSHHLAFSQRIVYILVDIECSDIERRAFEFSLLGMLFKLLGAVDRIAIFILQELLDNRTLGILAVYDISKLVPAEGTGISSLRSDKLNVVIVIGITGDDLYVYERFIRSGYDDLCEIVRVSACKSSGELAVYYPSLRIEIKEAESIAYRVRSGVI